MEALGRWAALAGLGVSLLIVALATVHHLTATDPGTPPDPPTAADPGPAAVTVIHCAAPTAEPPA